VNRPKLDEKKKNREGPDPVGGNRPSEETIGAIDTTAVLTPSSGRQSERKKKGGRDKSVPVPVKGFTEKSKWVRRSLTPTEVPLDRIKKNSCRVPQSAEAVLARN